MRAIVLILTLLLAITTTTAAELSETTARVLLITDESLADAWKPFAEWKTSCGKPTRIVTVQHIKATYAGKDIQAKIQDCVKTHVASDGTKWIVLGGDSSPGGKGLVPDRDTSHNVRVYGMRYADIPTDLYYISEKSWDSNNNGVYGEWPADNADVTYSTGDLSIGRIPVRTAADVEAYTAKVIAYETAYPRDAFSKNMVYTCAVPEAEPKLLRSWDDHVGKNWQDGKVLRFFTRKTPWDKDRAGDHDLSPANWVKMINDRTAGKIHIHGHGFLPCWVLEGDKQVTNRTVTQLKNSGAYPMMTTVSCFTGQYDSAKDPSITESMLRAPDAGAITIVAPSREGFPAFHDPRQDIRRMMRDGKLDGTTVTMTRFWDLGLQDRLTAGEALMAAKKAMADDAVKTAAYHLVQCELNLLGDPTLQIRGKAPVVPHIEMPQTLRTGTQSLTIKTSPGLTICTWKEGECYAVKIADAAGEATFELAPRSSGVIKVTVSGPDANAVCSAVQVEGKAK
jgi:hypothetical protein